MGLFGKLIGAVIDVTTLPITIVKDVVTLGGVLDDKDTTYTGDKLKELNDDLRDL